MGIVIHIDQICFAGRRIDFENGHCCAAIPKNVFEKQQSQVVAQADGAPAKVRFETETEFCRGATGCFENENETELSLVIIFSDYL